MIGRLRLPVAPPAIYEPEYTPPVAPAPNVPDGEIGVDSESTLVSVNLPDSSTVPVYATQRRWRALDVYVDTVAATIGAIATLSVGVFAIVRGMRVLVASGRTRAGAGSTNQRPMRICSVRSAVAERFEVVLEYDDIPASSSEEVSFAVIATDEALPDDDSSDGVVPLSVISNNLQTLATQSLSAQSSFRYQLVGLSATALVASRWLHVHDKLSGSPAGLAPVYSFGLPSVGSTVFGTERTLFTCRRLFKAGVMIAVSSTGDVTTLGANGDVAFMGLVR